MTEPEFLAPTRAFYNAVAADYADHFHGGLAAKPLDRALLAAFAELVHATDLGPVADLGCGPGTVTAYLHTLGVPVFGVDLSPAMVRLAQQIHPHLRFDQGSMTALKSSDGSVGGIVAWYSIIHTPPARIPEIFAEFHRVLAPGGHLLLAFQVGDEPLHVENPWGHPVSLDFVRWSSDRLAALAAQAGLVEVARLRREREQTESAPQAYLVARRPADATSPDPPPPDL